MGEPTSLSRIFIARLGGAHAVDLVHSEGTIEALLKSLDRAGRAAWPTIPLDEEAFVSHVADSVGAQPDVEEALAALHGEDLFLTCACARGTPAALAEFDRVYLSNVPVWVKRMPDR